MKNKYILLTVDLLKFCFYSQITCTANKFHISRAYRLKSVSYALYDKENELFEVLVAGREDYVSVLDNQLHTQLRQIVFVGFVEQIHPGIYSPSQHIFQLNRRSITPSPINLIFPCKEKTQKGYHSSSKIKFSDFQWLSLPLFPDPSEVQLLVLCNFSELILPYTDSFPSPFVRTCSQCAHSFFQEK